MLIQKIILNGIFKIGKERSITSVYYILQGKKSIQTIQDARLFGLEQYFAVCPSLTKGNFQRWMILFCDHGLIEETKEGNYLLLDKGKDIIESPYFEDFLQGKAYHGVDVLLFNRLQLVIQIWTNARQGNKQYIPVIDHMDTLKWAKTFYGLTKHKVLQYLNQLYQELHGVLKKVPSYMAEMFVEQITAWNMIGQSVEQLAMNREITAEEINLLTKNTLHFILREVHANKKNYPILSLFMKETNKISSLTQSARKTKDYLNMHMSIEQIAVKRRLKINTIQDHIVEIALNNHNFSIHQYISKEKEKIIIHAIQQAKSYRLKEIKSCVGDDISYFEIRLLLTRIDPIFDGDRYD